MSIEATTIDKESRTALLTFRGENNITLGSALGPNQQARDWLDSLPMFPQGPFSKQNQKFIWTESAKY